MAKKGLMFLAVPTLGFMGVFPMKGYQRLAAAVLGVALLSVLLVACGPQSPTASPAQTATPAPTVEPTPTTLPDPTQLTTNQATTPAPAPTAQPTPARPVDTPQQTEVPVPNRYARSNDRASAHQIGGNGLPIEGDSRPSRNPNALPNPSPPACGNGSCSFRSAASLTLRGWLRAIYRRDGYGERRTL